MFCTIRIVRAAFRRISHLLWLAALFAFFWAFLIVQIFWQCEARKDWRNDPMPICDFSNAVPLCRFIADLSGDVILLLVSARLFTIIQEKKLRTRLVLIFGTSIITTLVSVPLFALVLSRRAPILEFVAALVENSVSLVVCNFPVLFTAIVKLQDQAGPPSSPDDIKFQTDVASGASEGHVLVDSDRHLEDIGPGMFPKNIVLSSIG